VVAVSQGQTLDVCVGIGGGAGGSGSNSGGSGGGASGVSVGSTFSAPVLVAAGGGGGGGGGGSSLAGAGGRAGVGGGAGTGSGGSAGTTAGGGGGGGNGSAGSADAGGTGASATNAGGGGGGGYYGGGGGAGSGVGGGGGGGGGADYCNASGCGAQTASGNPQVTLTYSVSGAPTITIAVPASGAVYSLNQVIGSSFSCTEDAGGAGVSSCVDQNGQASGAPLDTSTPGTHTVTVTATSSDGLSSDSTVTYSVAAPPRLWMPVPLNGATYTLGEAINSWYLCGDGTGGPGLKSCADQNGAPSGAPLDTSRVGNHTFTVTAVSEDGQTASTSATYRVIPVPAVSHVATHRGGLVTMQVTVYGPGTIDVLDTAGLKSFALAADIIHPPNGSFVFGSAHLLATRSRTLRVKVGLSDAGRLLLRDHRSVTLHLWVVYTPLPGGSPHVIKSLVLRINR
jgi:hypothetical protein